MANRSRPNFRSALTAVLMGGAFVALAVLELRRPLRRRREPTVAHVGRNVGMALLSAVTVSLLDRPVVGPVAETVARRRWGLLYQAPLPPALRDALGVLLLDYTLYVWHVLLHRVPLLWRFHLVHHIDLDLDTSTALRFHFGELALSVPYRLTQVTILGISPRALGIWQRLLFLSVLFHHSALRLPIGVERIINRLVVTPRMHGIHHSIVVEETNSNWSSGLTLWDVLHSTARLNVPQQELEIGVPAYRGEEQVRLETMVALPFEAQGRWWRFPDGQEPQPHVSTVPPTTLLP